MPSRKTQLAYLTSAVVVAGAMVLGTLTATEEVAAQQANMQDIMRSKLENGQALLRAVVLGEHALVERHANELTLLSEASTWTPLTTPQYLRYAADFREISTRLRDEARNRDMERVAFAYTELVTTCVQCHRHVRGAQRAD